MPMVALVLAAAAVMYGYPTPTKTVMKESAGSCQTKYCQAAEMFVDRPLNTLLKDQSLGVGLQRPKNLPGPSAVYSKIKTDLQREQLLSPGVKLVAHTVA